VPREQPENVVSLIRSAETDAPPDARSEISRPPSATAVPTAVTGLAALLSAVLLLRDAEWALYIKTLGVVAITAAAMVAVDLGWFRTSRNPESGLAPAAINAWSANRIVRKLIGFAATLGALALAYSVLPEYAGSFYDPVRNAAWTLLPWLLIAAPIYVVAIDRRQRDPEDAYAELGGLLTAQSWPTDWTALGQHARGWLVKGFFLPLMFVYLAGDLDILWRTELLSLVSFRAFFDFAYNALFILDLLFAVIGYLLTLRLLDTHIRSTDPTMTGWVVCLVCYQPFWSLVERQYFHNEQDGLYWDEIVAGYPLLHVMWGSAILLCLAIYSISTVVFGLRFSNLTHRGIITSGPYRWTKHPAYISKCLSFWLISVPFVSDAGWGTAAAQTFMLIAANGLYVARAITEERHLARDPAYRAYQAYIREHGLFARLRRLATSRSKTKSGAVVPFRHDNES
jgi:protein-S-isoprenylcysteine O-methyltransferase Ste14